MRPVFITMPALYWLAPVEELFKESLIVKTSKKEYKVKDIYQLLLERGDFLGATQYLDNKLPIYDPGLPMYPIYGTGVNTEAVATYPDDCKIPHHGHLFDC